MGAEHRLLKLEEKLITLGFDETLRAIDLMKNEMSAAKGFKRHDGSDYFYHLSDVTLILVNAGIKDQPTLTGSMNHDFPEDVNGISVETVKHLFGKEVSGAVGPLTKVKGINYKDLANLKAYYGLLIDSKVSEKPVLSNWRSSVIKAGDIMHNMSTLGDASRDKKIRKIQEAKEVYIPFLREARNKFPRFASFFYLAKFAIEPIISEMEARYEKEIQQEERIKYLESKLGMDKNASLY
ncbi:gp304 [Bacillus phage G]|uniref:Gp304 n=1 Tax=Bacillus phage G TaxID=2884420 RepID=G3MA45_9CAUD|nr:gp304 [Bacillus phage G]AEO93563.1 gp304 [Bacillus phage G]